MTYLFIIIGIFYVIGMVRVSDHNALRRAEAAKAGKPTPKDLKVWNPLAVWVVLAYERALIKSTSPGIAKAGVSSIKIGIEEMKTLKTESGSFGIQQARRGLTDGAKFNAETLDPLNERLSKELSALEKLNNSLAQ